MTDFREGMIRLTTVVATAVLIVIELEQLYGVYW